MHIVSVKEGSTDSLHTDSSGPAMENAGDVANVSMMSLFLIICTVKLKSKRNIFARDTKTSKS